jgi:hypothetical protein
MGKTILDVFILEKYLLKSSPELAGQFQSNHPYIKGIQVCTNRGKGEMIAKNRVGSFKNVFLKNH